jgi:DNA (cytosine-5)-methyltransferase 1
MEILNKETPAQTVTASDHNASLRAFLLNSNASERNDYFRENQKPAYTTKISDGGRLKAFIVPGGNTSSFKIRTDNQPVNTIDTMKKTTSHKAWLSQGRVVKISPRGLARFQSIPDWFILPDNKALACKGIGNGWPSLMAQKILETFT